MRLLAGIACKPLVGAILGAVLGMVSWNLLAQAPAVPSVALPSAFRNQPADAEQSKVHDPALGEPELARLLLLVRAYSPARAQAQARISAVPRSFSGNETEKQIHEAELARIDHQLAEELAHAWIDGRAAAAKLDIARVLDALGAQGLQLVNQRLAAGLATQADLERIHETAIKARTLAARAVQERGAAVARVAALAGEQAGEFAPPKAILASASASPFQYPIRGAAPAILLDRPEVRAARLRLQSRDASPAELAASYRETVLKAVEETETAYAAAVSARAQRGAATDLVAAATRQAAAVLAQLDAGRISRVQHIEVQISLQDARLRLVEADAAYARALATLERGLGP